jgi:hypothetical protein
MVTTAANSEIGVRYLRFLTQFRRIIGNNSINRYWCTLKFQPKKYFITYNILKGARML